MNKVQSNFYNTSCKEMFQAGNFAWMDASNASSQLVYSVQKRPQLEFNPFHTPIGALLGIWACESVK